jgi:hypothetical protein
LDLPTTTPPPVESWLLVLVLVDEEENGRPDEWNGANDGEDGIVILL